jgi:hypothetical protein
VYAPRNEREVAPHVRVESLVSMRTHAAVEEVLTCTCDETHRPSRELGGKIAYRDSVPIDPINFSNHIAQISAAMTRWY